MLLVVLLSAMPTGGAPRTLVVGSAFDPASMAVSLGPKRALIKPGAAGADKLRNRAAPAAHSFAAPRPWPGLAALAVPPSARPQPSWSDFRRHSPAGAGAASHAARAPPAA
jgi:hypothetical protein